MRLGLLLTLALALAGCGNDKGGSGNDLSMSIADLSAGADDLAGGGGDLAGGNNGDGGLVTDGGTVGTTCTTACDCMPGLGCFANKCTVSNTPVYCCSSSDCPSGAVCQHSTGNYGRCGVGTPDLAAFDYCTLLTCNGAGGTTRCTNSGCTACVANGNGGMSCQK